MLSFENEDDRTSFSEYCIPSVEIKDFNLLIDGKNFFDVWIKNKEEICEKIIEMSSCIIEIIEMSQCTSTLKRLVIMIIFHNGNLRACLMKLLNQLIIYLLNTKIYWQKNVCKI